MDDNNVTSSDRKTSQIPARQHTFLIYIRFFLEGEMNFMLVLLIVYLWLAEHEVRSSRLPGSHFSSANYPLPTSAAILFSRSLSMAEFLRLLIYRAKK